VSRELKALVLIIADQLTFARPMTKPDPFLPPKAWW